MQFLLKSNDGIYKRIKSAYWVRDNLPTHKVLEAMAYKTVTVTINSERLTLARIIGE